MWEIITNIILGIAILTLVAFLGLGLYQWVKRGGIEKVDKEIAWIWLPVVLMAITYFIFDKFIILATRPNGSGESSWPSTHVMVVATIFFIVTIILPHYIKDRTTRIVLEVLMVIAISLTWTGRIMANMHSLGDVIAGLVFAFLFSEVYCQVIKRSSKNAKRIHKNHQR